MAIEKMVLVSIEGTLKKVNRALMKCCESECFHIIPSTHTSENYFSSQNFKTLKDRNLFVPIVKRAINLAEGLGIKLEYCYYDDIDYNVSVDFARYFKGIDDNYKSLRDKQEQAQTSLNQHLQVLDELEQLAGLSSNFEEIFAMKYIKVRFGRLPVDSYPKLKYFDDKIFCFFPFETHGEYVWGVYFVPNNESVVVDDIFKSIFFERVRMPDYLTGTADDAKTYILKLIQREQRELDYINTDITELKNSVSEKFSKVYCKLKALSDSFELRTNVSVINNRFFLNGYIPKKQAEKFRESLETVETVTAQIMPHDSDPNSEPPIRLKNNWLFKPFEMFVTMYGLPGYGRVDPTPFVAVTYMLIYGIMFGDLGQGLFIALLGFILTRWKHLALGPVMTRIGISSAFFGVIYGSLFGNEKILHPFFKIESVYKFMGFHEPPEDIFQISSFLLIGSLVLGIVLILITMFINIVNCLRKRDFLIGFFGASGVAGLALYSSVVYGAVMKLAFGYDVFSIPYVLGLIILPLFLLLFKEPISKITDLIAKKQHGIKLNKNTALVHSIKTYSDAISKVSSVNSEEYNLEQLIECKYLKSQYGTISYDSYEKLSLFFERKFFFFPFESNDLNVTGIYLAAEIDFPSVDKLFTSLGFVKMRTPAHIGDITKETKKRSEKNKNEGGNGKEKLSIGNFIIEGVIDLFETALTYVTNSMSFLRIGGFVLSHAGLMLVVNILAEKFGDAGSVGWIITQIFGNLFVIGMEGFLVAIQVLRLEFYEMFSRFYVSSGKPFKPIVVDLKLDN